MVDSYTVISWVGIICVEVLLVPPAGTGQDVEGNAGAGGTQFAAEKDLWRSWGTLQGKELSPCCKNLAEPGFYGPL